MSKEDDDQAARFMKHLARINQARLAKCPPPGFRASDDGKSIVRIGDPHWPIRPFEQLCSQWCEPDSEFVELAGEFVPDFDPATNDLSWALLKEVVLHTGRRLEDVEKMTKDEIQVFLLHQRMLRHTDCHGRGQKSGGNSATKDDASRQGSNKRLVLLDFATMLGILHEKKPETRLLSAPQLEPYFVEEFGEKAKVTSRTIRKLEGYKKLQHSIKFYRERFGEEAWQAVKEGALQLWGHKPGRGDKRKEWNAKYERAFRDFIREQAEILEEEKLRVANERRKRAARAEGNQSFPDDSFRETDFAAE